jgi:hypothetical protein
MRLPLGSHYSAPRNFKPSRCNPWRTLSNPARNSPTSRFTPSRNSWTSPLNHPLAHSSAFPHPALGASSGGLDGGGAVAASDGGVAAPPPAVVSFGCDAVSAGASVPLGGKLTTVGGAVLAGDGVSTDVGGVGAGTAFGSDGGNGGVAGPPPAVVSFARDAVSAGASVPLGDKLTTVGGAALAGDGVSTDVGGAGAGTAFGFDGGDGGVAGPPPAVVSFARDAVSAGGPGVPSSRSGGFGTAEVSGNGGSCRAAPMLGARGASAACSGVRTAGATGAAAGGAGATGGGGTGTAVARGLAGGEGPSPGSPGAERARASPGIAVHRSRALVSRSSGIPRAAVSPGGSLSAGADDGVSEGGARTT